MQPQVILPGKGDDRILALVAENCPALEVALNITSTLNILKLKRTTLPFSFLQELDVSNSFITDKGLLSICGVTVTEVSNRVVLETSMRGIVQVAARKRGIEEVEEEEQERGEVK